jgi:hypothetical protein
MPELFEVVALNEDGLEKAPHPNVPYYLKALEGDYLYRDTQIGTVLLPERKMPKLGRIGYKDGVFTWSGDKIPGSIISQAQNFFRRIYDKHHAEAEVLITMHNDTKAFRLFVPYQRVSHSGVKSIYEPTHVDRNYTVVGTLHSHCDFSAFHSGTDSGDASDMDGVHFTIGHNTREVPEIVAMVAMAGKEFHYKDPSEIADIEYGTATAPEWWDQYVFPGGAPQTKPKGMKSLTQAHWDQFLGIALVKPKVVKQWKSPERKNGWVSPYNGATPMGPNGKGPHIFNGRDIAEKDMDWRKWVYGGYTRPSDITVKRPGNPTSDPDIDLINEALDLAEATGTFTDADWTNIAASDIDDTEYWQEFFIGRIEAIAQVLEILGVTLDYSTTDRWADEKEPQDVVH